MEEKKLSLKGLNMNNYGATCGGRKCNLWTREQPYGIEFDEKHFLPTSARLK